MEHKVIKAEDGKVFRRKSDGMIFGDEITLGYTSYIGGQKLAQPKLEVEEDFEQIEAQEENIEQEVDNLDTVD